MSLFLQLTHLPDGELPVDVAVVDEEDGVVGGVLQCGHAIGAGAADPGVDGVVRHLKLHLKVTVVTLLKGQQHLAVEERLLALFWISEQLGTWGAAGRHVLRGDEAVVEWVVLFLCYQTW